MDNDSRSRGFWVLYVNIQLNRVGNNLCFFRGTEHTECVVFQESFLYFFKEKKFSYIIKYPLDMRMHAWSIKRLGVINVGFLIFLSIFFDVFHLAIMSLYIDNIDSLLKVKEN